MLVSSLSDPIKDPPWSGFSSTRRTFFPDFTAIDAAVRPAGPLPTIKTSQW